MKTVSRLCCVTFLAVATLAQEPLNTAFTYQGQLKQAGAPVSGLADFEFTLWDDPELGSPVGPVVAVNEASVNGGLFTVPLDFGVEVFNGDARWLDIAVRAPAGGGSFTTLSPRQPLSAVPYALQARGIYCDTDGQVGIGNTSPQHRLSVGGSTADWQTVGIRSYGDTGGAWQGGAAFGYDSGAVIVGELYDTATIGGHSSDLGAWADLAINPAGGNVGIGTSAPSQRLTVAGTIESTSGGFKFPDGTVQTTTAGTHWSINGTDIYYTDGNVSIGTATPIVDGLTVHGTVSGHSFLGDGSALWYWDCTQSSEGLDCGEHVMLDLGLLEEQLHRLCVLTDPGPPEEFVCIDFEKRWREPRLTPESFDVHIALNEDPGVHTFSVSPESPIYNLKSDPSYQGTFYMRVHLVSAGRLDVVLYARPLQVKRVAFVSPGYIMDAHAEPYAPGASEAQVSVRIKNGDELKADYIVTVTECDFDVEPIVYQARVLEAKQEVDVVFDLRHGSGTFSGGERCKVTMYSSIGRLYDFKWVTFPPPTTAPGGRAAPAEATRSRDAEIAELRARLERLEALVAELATGQQETER